jgi:hypothetical protein
MLRKRIPSALFEDLNSTPITSLGDKINLATIPAVVNPKQDDGSLVGVLGLAGGDDILGPGISILTTDAHDRVLGLPGTDKLRLATDKLGLGDTPLNIDIGSSDTTTTQPDIVDTKSKGQAGVPAREPGLVVDLTDLDGTPGKLGLGSLAGTLRGARVRRMVSVCCVLWEVVSFSCMQVLIFSSSFVRIIDRGA